MSSSQSTERTTVQLTLEDHGYLAERNVWISKRKMLGPWKAV